MRKRISVGRVRRFGCCLGLLGCGGLFGSRQWYSVFDVVVIGSGVESLGYSMGVGWITDAIGGTREPAEKKGISAGRIARERETQFPLINKQFQELTRS